MPTDQEKRPTPFTGVGPTSRMTSVMKDVRSFLPLREGQRLKAAVRHGMATRPALPGPTSPLDTEAQDWGYNDGNTARQPDRHWTRVSN